MKAWRVAEYGEFRDVLRWEEVEEPTPGPGEVLVRVAAAGVMFADILSIAGGYQVKSPLPFVPGAEAAGVIEAVGEGVVIAPGTRVAVVSLAGAFGEKMLAPAMAVYPIPDSMSFEQAAALTINYQTAYFGLQHRGQLQEGEWLLIHGGAGGVGTAAIQLGKALGAKVIATASTERKRAVCKECGADVVLGAEQGFAKAVMDATGQHGADVIFDPVGGDVFDESTKCIAFEGRLVVIGFASGRIPEIKANRVLLKNIGVVGLFWGNYQLHNPGLIRKAQETLYRLFDEGRIEPKVSHSYPLARLPEAMTLISERLVEGKAVVTASNA